MDSRSLLLSFMLSVGTVLVQCEYHKEISHTRMKEKVTQLHFYLHDIQSGLNPSALRIAHANNTHGNSPMSFGSFFAINDLLTEGPKPTSTVIGNAQGMYILSGENPLTLVMNLDFGFTTGKFNGSSISIFSRNPISEGKRELAVVGGREKFRRATGFALLDTKFFNRSSGDAIVEYKVTVFHY